MLWNDSKNGQGVDQVFAILRNSSFMFYPTGSRFFGCQQEESDYDFFVQDKEEYDQRKLQLFLEQNNFDRDISTVYQDAEVLAVYCHKHYKIHIQIVAHAENKQKVQELIKQNNIMSYIYHWSKPQKIKFWDFCYQLYYTQPDKTLT